MNQLDVLLPEKKDLLLVLHHLQADPNLYSFLDEDLADELAAQEFFDISNWRITERSRLLLQSAI